MKRLTLLTLTTITLMLASVLAVRAQGQEASPSAVPDEAVTESIKERLQKVAQDNQEQTTLKRAWVGTLKNVSGLNLTIETLAETKQAEVATDAAILDENRQSVKLANLEVGKPLIAMGFVGDANVLDTKRILVIDELPVNTLKAYRVVLKEVIKTTLNVTDSQGNALTLATTKNTNFTHAVDGALDDIVPTDLQLEDILIIIGEPDPKAPTAIDTLAVHLITERSILAEPTTATPSATPR